jgi:hypothetical protein
MAARRSKIQREADLEKVAAAYLSGRRQTDIATAIGVSQGTVSNYLKRLQKRWQESALIKFDEARGKELAKIDHLERQYWRGWRVSRHDEEIKMAERTTGDVELQKTATRRRPRVGDPAFLRGIEWCIDQRCKILGLVKKEAPAEPTPPTVNVTIQQALVPLSDEDKRLLLELRRKHLASQADERNGIPGSVPTVVEQSDGLHARNGDGPKAPG